MQCCRARLPYSPLQPTKLENVIAKFFCVYLMRTQTYSRSRVVAAALNEHTSTPPLLRERETAPQPRCHRDCPRNTGEHPPGQCNEQCCLLSTKTTCVLHTPQTVAPHPPSTRAAPHPPSSPPSPLIATAIPASATRRWGIRRHSKFRDAAG